VDPGVWFKHFLHLLPKKCLQALANSMPEPITRAEEVIVIVDDMLVYLKQQDRDVTVQCGRPRRVILK
jgi:hypothetical protein